MRKRRLSASERIELIGDPSNGFSTPEGGPMYRKVGKHQLRRIGATDHCIVCGMPDHPGVLAFAHIDPDDVDLSPGRDPDRVFRLCWHHHHGCYDQGHISTLELLEAEAKWIANENRPTPHERDVKLMGRVEAGEVVRRCRWTEPKRAPTRPPSNARSVAALRAYAARSAKRAAEARTEAERARCIARQKEFLDRAEKLLADADRERRIGDRASRSSPMRLRF